MKAVRTALWRVAVVAFVAALGLVIAAPAPAAPIHVRVPITITATDGNCCFTSVDFAGTAAVPLLGKATFAGELLLLGTPEGTGTCEVPFEVVPCQQTLSLQLAGSNGREVSMRGDAFWVPPEPRPTPLTWETTGGDLTGAGTYASPISGSAIPGVGEESTLTLHGSLRRG
jgi:hypothetical protein